MSQKWQLVKILMINGDQLSVLGAFVQTKFIRPSLEILTCDTTNKRSEHFTLLSRYIRIMGVKIDRNIVPVKITNICNTLEKGTT